MCCCVLLGVGGSAMSDVLVCVVGCWWQCNEWCVVVCCWVLVAVQ